MKNMWSTGRLGQKSLNLPTIVYSDHSGDTGEKYASVSTGAFIRRQEDLSYYEMQEAGERAIHHKEHTMRRPDTKGVKEKDAHSKFVPYMLKLTSPE